MTNRRRRFPSGSGVAAFVQRNISKNLGSRALSRDTRTALRRHVWKNVGVQEDRLLQLGSVRRSTSSARTLHLVNSSLSSCAGGNPRPKGNFALLKGKVAVERALRCLANPEKIVSDRQWQ
jgi:hypothetical protein